ncbi:hypothetical protein KUV89_13210 [Marinobacter hydrocarbonoclasticus]|nr:hypothetical protein [Marinobacter nauticus]
MGKFALLAALLGGVLTMGFTVKAAEPGETVQVVMNGSVDAKAVSLDQLRAIFSLKQLVWPDGSTVTVVVLPSQHPTHHQFCRAYLGLLPYQLERTWKAARFSMPGDRPVTVATEQEMREVLESTPGAIGYLTAELVADSLLLPLII